MQSYIVRRTIFYLSVHNFASNGWGGILEVKALLRRGIWLSKQTERKHVCLYVVVVVIVHMIESNIICTTLGLDFLA